MKYLSRIGNKLSKTVAGNVMGGHSNFQYQTALMRSVPELGQAFVSAYAAKKNAEVRIAEIKKECRIERGKLDIAGLAIRKKGEENLRRLENESRIAARRYDLMSEQLKKVSMPQETLLRNADRILDAALKEGIPAEQSKFFMGAYLELIRKNHEIGELVMGLGRESGQ